MSKMKFAGVARGSGIESLEQRRLMSVNVAVDAAQQDQAMAGFGSALYSASSEPYMTPGSAAFNTFVNDYANDLGSQILRINFDSDVLPNKPATPLGTSLSANIAALNFQSKNALLYGSTAEAINKAEGGKLQVIATIWSPPAWMKANDSLSAIKQPDGYYDDPLNHLLFQDNTAADNDQPGNDLDPANLTQFARYCAAYIAGMEQTYDIKIVGLSIQNEPLFNEPYDSCSYYQVDSLDPTNVEYYRYAEALQAVGGELLHDGLDTQMMGPESVGPDGDTVTPPFTERQMDYIEAIDADTDVDAYGNTAADYLGTTIIHGWTGDGSDPSSNRDWWEQYAAELAAEPVQRRNWQTEESGDANTWTGTTSTGAANPLRGALGLGLEIHDSIVYGDQSAYLYWQTADGSQTDGGTELMSSDPTTQADPERSDVPQWKFDVFKHWSHFVESGSTRVGTSYADDDGNAETEDPTTVNTDAYTDAANSTLTVELTNESPTAETVNLSIQNTTVAYFDQAWLTDSTNTWANFGTVQVANGFATLTMPGYSILTLQGSTAVGSVSGVVFADSNDNAKQDAGEAGVGNETVFLDTNNSGVFDAGEPSTTTAADGTFSFPALDAGSYVARVLAPGWRQTSPAAGAGIAIAVTAGEQSALSFGLIQTPPVAVPGGPYMVPEGGTVALNGAASYELAGSIASYQWDTDYNGVRFDPTLTGATPTFSAAGLDGLATRTVALEVTGADGLVSAPVTATVSITNVAPTATFQGGTTTLGSAATVTFSNDFDPSPADVAAGFTYDYDFTDSGTFELTNQTSPTATVPAAYLTTLGLHAVRGRIVDKDGGYTDYTTAVQVKAAPLSGSISGSVFNDVNGNGIFDPAEAGVAGITVYIDANNNGVLDAGELTTSTSATGAYSFAGLAAGNYKIRAIVPPGEKQTTPANNYGWTVAMKANQVVTGDNFGQQAVAPKIGTISGAVTGGLAGETIYLDANNNSVLDSGELSTTTSSTGTYSFSGVPIGAYVVRQLLPSGYAQTSPADNYGNHVTVTPGSASTGDNFTDAIAYTKLTGVTIGTAGSYDNSGNTIASATDGNLSTFFDAQASNGNWVGLDLGSSKTISQIAFAPRTSYASRMTGGEFQISTTADFSSGVTTIYTITAAPAAGLTTVTLSSPVTARYIRYLSPDSSHGDIAEFQIFS